MKKYQKETRVIPGFGLSMGVTMTMLTLIVIIPLTSLFWNTMDLSFAEFIQTITSKRVLSGYHVSLQCALIASLINAVMGVILAWVLVRYSFPGKKLLDGLLELPFALPTAIAGIALTSLTADGGWVGRIFADFGIHIAYTRLGIIAAMVFVGEPFVVRSIQPVLATLDGQYEEAAEIMGAGKVQTFFQVIFPEILPSLLTGFGLAFARCLGEYGSVIFIAGNKPYSTEIAPLLIMSKLQQYDYAQATAIAIVLLVISFLILFAMNVIQIHAAKRTS